ncbi:MAG: L-threonylcarbamoyladenylate synthase, partial [Desulfonatronovibrionaceae bacterium]
MSVVSRDIHRAVRVVKRGGVLVYPTETFWALGGSACSSEAVLQTARIKNRPPDKPLPVVIGCMEHLSAFFRPRPEELQIAALFWPGPLSIVVRGGPDLAPVLADSRGRVSVRWSAHAAACGLAVQTGVPLVSTSANPSGWPPAREFIELHKDIKDRADVCFVS